MSDVERRRNNDKTLAPAEDRRRGPDTLRSNPEVMERKDAEATRSDPDMRSNPEVMGRSEPRTMTPTRQPETGSEMSNVRLQFEQLQSEFIDDPKSAVKKAEKLMEELVTKLQERIHNVRRDTEKSDDTEHMRLAMRSYRDLIDSFGGRRSV